jgi:hypothetical protein
LTDSAPSKKYRLVPRAAGDTTPVDPKVADAIRKAGMDPAKFTVEPFEAGEADLPVAALFTPGSRLEHTFGFDTLDGALSAIERVVDDEYSARIGKHGAKWVVVFDGRADSNVAAFDIHQRIATRVIELGAEDRGFSHLTMNVTRKVG